ncbi:FUSC family protein [Chryseobacterium suipulveris]|uniref:FUSC family protein n=1 Tax=Chryseobacterium suipulveris TaxID=2929800 RepID=A0ABY4BWA4_9FLAO|nr:FUSC family protein [Chryseobacterium suipulveris]UOE42151.1 FUSC family protein [Chryseobacterium suipulveris]
MRNKEVSQLTSQELLEEVKKLKSFSITNALFIGVLFGIVFFSIYRGSFGFVMLIPLFFIYKMVKDPKNKKFKEVEELLKERNLKF